MPKGSIYKGFFWLDNLNIWSYNHAPTISYEHIQENFQEDIISRDQNNNYDQDIVFSFLEIGEEFQMILESFIDTKYVDIF